MNELLHQIGNAGIWVSLAAAVAFCAGYAVVAPWQSMPEGRHLMMFTGVLAFAFGWLAFRQVFHPAPAAPLPTETPRAVLFVALAVLLVWRLWLLIRAQITSRRNAMSEPFTPPPADEPVPAPGPSDQGAPDLPDPPDDGVEYVDPLSMEGDD